MGHSCEHCIGQDATMVSCEICFAIVLAAHHDDHLKWHRTMTNLPAREPVIMEHPVKFQ